jgi:pSer/pThr/pTyr-binding forkhead associated (FHA) protein
MKLILEVTSGPDAPRSVVIEPGTAVQVGRLAPAQVLLANDRTVSRLHFALVFDGQTCRIQDLGSTHGTTVNGMPVSEALVTDGDLIVAGTTGLRVVIGDDLSTEALPLPTDVEPPTELAPTIVESVENQEHEVLEPTQHDRVLEILRSQKEPLYAILDAARDPMVYLRIHECQEQKQSLYEGPGAARLAFVAPYLISLPKGSPSLEQLVREGWGQSWGVYLASSERFAAVRKHFRRFLLVKSAEDGRTLYFRFYDPRVLRVFLPTCDPFETAEFFGPIGAFLMEADDPGTLLQFTPGGLGAEQTKLAVLIEAGAEAFR